MGRRAERPEPPASLLVFVDGRPAQRFAGDPGRPPREPYAYSRTRRSAALFVRCPEAMACAQTTVVRADARFSTALVRSRIARFPGHAWAVVVGLGLWTLAATWGTRSWPAARAWTMSVASLAALGLWLGLDLQSTAWSPCPSRPRRGRGPDRCPGGRPPPAAPPSCGLGPAASTRASP